jgi:hypothetical protein
LEKMTRSDIAYVIGFALVVIGVGLVLWGRNRGRGTIKGPGGLEVSGGAGIVLCALGLVTIFYSSKGGGECAIFCPTPPPVVKLEPRVSNYPERDTRQSDGKAGHISDIHLSLLPPDDKNPNGRWTASWIYSGSGGTQHGSQSILFHFKGALNSDLFTEPFPLARDGCHYGGVRQNAGGPLKEPMSNIKDVTMETTIVEGTTSNC